MAYQSFAIKVIYGKNSDEEWVSGIQPSQWTSNLQNKCLCQVTLEFWIHQHCQYHYHTTSIRLLQNEQLKEKQ